MNLLQGRIYGTKEHILGLTEKRKLIKREEFLSRFPGFTNFFHSFEKCVGKLDIANG